MPFLVAYRIPRPTLAIWLTVFALTFVWSITGTIALRHLLLVVVLGAVPFAGIDRSALKRSLQLPTVLLLFVLTVWIVSHNQFLAWNSDRAWSESIQWFKAMVCLTIGLAVGCTPRELPAELRWRWSVLPIAAAWALHLLLNIALKDWRLLSLSAAMQAGTPIGTRDMVSYLGTGLLALLLADGIARSAGRDRILPCSTRLVWSCAFAASALTAATMTRNSILVMALEWTIAMFSLIGASEDRQQRSSRLMVAIAALLLVAAAATSNIVLDKRWRNFADSARIAWDIDNNGWWIDQVKNPRPTNAQGVPVDHSAYNRIAWIRGASRLIAEYPLGTGYDRNAFRRALMKHYGAENTASGHAHAGLFDFTLGTGVPGGLLFVGALLSAIIYGWRCWQATRSAAGLALTLFAANYLARAAVDGIVRDHMLEQAMFVIGLLLVAVSTTGKPQESIE